jgi:hemoglobin
MGPMRTRLLLCSVILGAGLIGLAACGKKPPPKEPTITETVSDAGAQDAADAEPPKPKSLFERLNGKDGITKIVDAFITNVTHNDVIKKRFTKLPKEKVDKFRTNLIAQICKESGGDCEYTGKTMKEAHKGMKITEPEWNATVSALKAALDENKVGENEQNDLIAAIAPMKDDIVEVKAKPKTK